jgi:GTPase SAR1 family protein
MVSYVNTHFALEKLRDESSQRKSQGGPRVLIVGPSNSGKTSLVKLLTAYAIRMGQQPMVINTDSREGLLSIPGSLTATPFASIIDVEQGWGSSPTSSASPVPVKLPLCYYYGLPSPEDNMKLFKDLVKRLALAATGRLDQDPAIKYSGMIIDTPGIISQGKEGYDLISEIVSEFAGRCSALSHGFAIVNFIQLTLFSFSAQSDYTAKWFDDSHHTRLGAVSLSPLSSSTSQVAAWTEMTPSFNEAEKLPSGNTSSVISRVHSVPTLSK